VHAVEIADGEHAPEPRAADLRLDLAVRDLHQRV
jgi:hypothetical protein